MSEPAEQTALLDLSAKEYNAYWVDPQQPLIVPNNPLHWKAHELQILLGILKTQAGKNPAQFNSRNYIDTLAEYTKCVTLINKGATDETVLDEGSMDVERTLRSKAPAMGEGATLGMGAGVSTNNPLAG